MGLLEEVRHKHSKMLEALDKKKSERKKENIWFIFIMTSLFLFLYCFLT